MHIILALLFVLGLIGVAALLLRFFIKTRAAFVNHSARSLRLGETLYLDTKRRVVVVHYQEKKYLLLLGQNDLILGSSDNIEQALLDDQTQ